MMTTVLALLFGISVVAPASNERGHSNVMHARERATQARQLERLDIRGLKGLVRDRHGKALLINVWATWCAPCVEEFPDLVRLANDLKGKNVEIVAVSGDDIDDETTKVLPFLAKEKAPFRCFIAKLEGEDAFINAFDATWGGGIPATFVYDAKGHERAFLLGQQTYRSLRTAVEKALKN